MDMRKNDEKPTIKEIKKKLGVGKKKKFNKTDKKIEQFELVLSKA